MNAPIRIATVILAWVGYAARGAENQKDTDFHLWDVLPNGLLVHPKVQVSVITEMTDAGRAGPQASPESPIYFFGIDGGRVDVEQKSGESPPSFGALADNMKMNLARVGYLPQSREHPATVLITYHWGALNTRLNYLYLGQGNSLAYHTTTREEQVDRVAMVLGERFARLYAGEFDRDADLRRFYEDPNLTWKLQMASGDLYYIVATAFDLQAIQHDQRVVLWRTRICTNSRGLVMAGTLGTLVASAAPYFGKDMPESMLLRARIGKGTVTIGPMTVKGLLDRD